MFGREISRPGLLAAHLTLDFWSANRSQLRLLWLQGFSETSSLYFASRRWCFPHHNDVFEKNSFFYYLSCLGSPLAWFGLCSEELQVCVHVLPASSLSQKASPFAPASDLGASAAARGARLFAADPGSRGVLGVPWAMDTGSHGYRKQNI